MTKRPFTDAERLDWLEREANTDALVLHDGAPGRMTGARFRGLGLKGTGRSLRQAIDQAMRIPSASSSQVQP